MTSARGYARTSGGGSAGRSGGVGGRRRAWLEMWCAGERRKAARCDGSPRVVLWRPCVLVAQLDRASDSGSEGRGFESLRAHTDPRGRGGGRPDAGGPRCAFGRCAFGRGGTGHVSGSARHGRTGSGEGGRGRTHGGRGHGCRGGGGSRRPSQESCHSAAGTFNTLYSGLCGDARGVGEGDSSSPRHLLPPRPGWSLARRRTCPERTCQVGDLRGFALPQRTRSRAVLAFCSSVRW